MQETRAVDLPELKNRLRQCCLDSLPRLQLDEAGLLAKSVVWDGTAYRTTTPSVLDTANVLIALYEFRALGVESPLDADRLLDRCISVHLEGTGFAEEALLLWAASLGKVESRTLLWTAVQRHFARGISNTMLLSWALCAVCEYFKAGGGKRATKTVAGELHDRIRANQFSKTGLFFSSDDREGILRRRRSIAHLPTQVFAMQGLAKYSETFGQRRSADLASRCAARLCSLQGPQGQWWCVYDVRKGSVTQEYPVYSVHQDGAMPAALSLIGRTGQSRCLQEASDRGLMWIFGNNELGMSMLDETQGVVMRGIRREGTELSVIREMRGYHPGRCLHALAISGSG